MPRVRAALVSGVPSETQIPLVISTVDNPVANIVTVVINGSSYVSGIDFALSKVGTDRSTWAGMPANIQADQCAGWVGTLVITVPAGFAAYPWTCEQLGYTETGRTRSKAGINDDTAIWYKSCDNYGSLGGLLQGAYKELYDYDQLDDSLPVSGMWHVDDHGYANWTYVDDSNNTGHVKEAAILTWSLTEYDFCMIALATRGHFGSDDDTNLDTIGGGNYGRNIYRKWAYQNYNLFPQLGDQDTQNELGFNTNALKQTGVSISGNGVTATCALINHHYHGAGAAGVVITGSTIAGYNGTHKITKEAGENTFSFPSTTTGAATADVQAAGAVFGRAVWDVFYKPLTDTANLITSTAPEATHWAADVGCARLINPDGVSSGTGTNLDEGQGGEPTTLFGNQIADCLNAADCDQPFKFLGMMYTLRDPNNQKGYQNGGSSQNPLFESILAEFQEFFTAIGNTPPSLMDNPKTNGGLSITLSFHSDYHHSHVYRLLKDAYLDNQAEFIYEICVGTDNGSSNHPSNVTTGQTINSIDVEYDSGWLSTGHGYASCLIEMYGSRSLKEVEVTLKTAQGILDPDLITEWNKKFIENAGGNLAHDISTNLNLLDSSGSKSGVGL